MYRQFKRTYLALVLNGLSLFCGIFFSPFFIFRKVGQKCKVHSYLNNHNLFNLKFAKNKVGIGRFSHFEIRF